MQHCMSQVSDETDTSQGLEKTLYEYMSTELH